VQANSSLTPRNRMTEFDQIACQRTGKWCLSITGVDPRVCVCCVCGCCRVGCVCCLCVFEVHCRYLKSEMKDLSER
jgi:hypothetical protein